MENNQSNLQISKQFECSKETLYQAWTEPEQLKQWWKPLGKQLANVTNNIAEGGDVAYAFEDGSLKIDGQYQKVEAPDLLEYTWNWHLKENAIEDADYKLSVKFEGDESNSTLSITQEGFKSAESVQPHKQGWEQGLGQLKQFVSAKGKLNSEETSNEAGEQKPPVSGYNETPEQLKVGGA